MQKLVVIRVSRFRDYIIVGIFPEEGGESRMSFTLPSKLFPDDIQQGDEVVFCKKGTVLSIASRG